MNTPTNEPMRIAVNISPEEQPMIEQVARKIGTRSMAGAIRFIITEYARLSGYNETKKEAA